MEQMKLQTQRLLSYSVVYPDRHDRIEDLLADVPSNSAIEYIAFLISWKTLQIIGQKDFEVWCPWVLQCRGDVKNPIGRYIEKVDISGYSLIDRFALLNLIDTILCQYNDINRELNEDDKSNLLLSYLICCDKRLEIGKEIPNNKMTSSEFVRTFMPIVLNYNNIESDRDYRLQLIKCYSLLMEFPKVNEKFAGYVKAFCEEYELESAKEYLDQLFMLIFDIMKAGQGAAVMKIDETSHQAIRFIERFCIDVKAYKHTEDFHVFREYPVIMTGPYRYVFLFTKLFLDKAYTGLLFDMASALVNKKILKEKNAYGDLKGFLGEDFCEKYLFYKLMEKCFGRDYVKYSGKELKPVIGKGEPDYYMRKGNRLFVFECKDALLAIRYKLSGEYESIIKGVEEKYISNENEEPKGITQIANVIEKKISSILCDVDNRAPNGVKYIFPILVYFDDSFDVEGMNWHLNKRFHEIMGKRIIMPEYEVKDLVMINIEQLMRLENFFADGKLKLAVLINEYIDYKSRNELNQVFPFNKFVFQEARKKGYEMKKTRWFDEINQKLCDLERKELIEKGVRK